VTSRPRLAVQDHAAGLKAKDRRGDLIVVGDGSVLVAGLVEKLAYDLADRGLVFDEQDPRLIHDAMVAGARMEGMTASSCSSGWTRTTSS
jgi:hypothetical protein